MAEVSSVELMGDRTVSFKDEGGNAVSFRFLRIGPENWRKFFNGIVIESEQVGKQRIDRIDTRNAGLCLIKALLVDVEGYKTRDGVPVSSWPNWKDRLPYGHRVRAANLLQDVRVSDSPREMFLEPDVDRVILRAAWGSAVPGTMLYFDGLVHRFTPPSAEDALRYNRAMSEVRVVGGSRNGRTIYPSRQGLLADLYDRLILGVEGYTANGQPLRSRDEVVLHMDTFHKVAAAQELFATPETGEEQ